MTRLAFAHDGLHLAGYDRGKGPPVVFQHGMGGDVNQVNEHFPLDLLRCLTLECRAHGGSQSGPLTRLSIATFKLREGMPIGGKVTLRQQRMYEFLDRLVNVALPRVRDFRGLNPKSFDGRGNYAMGIKEHIIFPEINYDQVDQIWGMDVIVCTTANTDDEARALLKAFNFPFRQ